MWRTIVLVCMCSFGASLVRAAEPSATGASPTSVEAPHFKVALLGIRDAHDDRTDARALEVDLLRIARNWTGFDVDSPDQVAVSLSESERILLLTSDDPAHELAGLVNGVHSDYALVGAVRVDGGRSLVRLRLIELPEAVERWSDEAPVESFRSLLGKVRNGLYALANASGRFRGTLIAHTPPEIAVADAPMTLDANILCPHMYPMDVFYRFAPTGDFATDAAWSSMTIKFNAAEGMYVAHLPPFHAGVLQYYFWLGDDKLNNLTQLGSDVMPFSVRVVATGVSAAKSAPPPLSVAPPVVHRRLSLPTKIVLGAAGAALVAGLSMGFASHALHLGNITEVQAWNARSYKMPTTVVLSLSGALAVAGGVLLGIDLLHPAAPASPPQK